MRSISDLTATSGMQGYTTLSSTPMNPPTSPTIMTHQSSVRSVPYFSSVVASTVPQGTSSPPPLPTSTSPPPRNREDVVEPFTLPPSNIADRKQPNGAYPIYDPPTALPPAAVRNMEITRPTTPTQRTRYNPPTYSESTTGGPSSPPPRAIHRSKQGSTDTLPSITSSRTHGQRQTPAHSPNSSVSGMGNISGQIGVTNPAPGTPPTHSRQVSGSRDEKRQPTEDSFNLA
ncbi:hypothetical protein CPB84DRAFT_1768534 [Gymnopilus junonius]|uniref:Uncharacterized protein n=1 Tax=Gymnopilus junonius TaxID=109634 RepID=A0A9P5NXA3_GYMJU|nr:hypothetical protein CPB84DRAFT_1768534 [Gymnopilus junonius]